MLQYIAGMPLSLTSIKVTHHISPNVGITQGQKAVCRYVFPQDPRLISLKWCSKLVNELTAKTKYCMRLHCMDFFC